MLCAGPGAEELGSTGTTCIFPGVGWSDLESMLSRRLRAVGFGSSGARGLTGMRLGGGSFNADSEERGLDMVVV